MSETVQIWLFGMLFVSVGFLFLWMVALKIKMEKFIVTALEIRADVRDSIEAIEAHERREDSLLKELKQDVKQVNKNLLALAVRVGEISR